MEDEGTDSLVAAPRESGVVICQLADPEGERLGPQIALPLDVGPLQLQEIVNARLKNVSPRFMKFPFAAIPILCSFAGGEAALCVLYTGRRARGASWNLLAEEETYVSTFDEFFFLDLCYHISIMFFLTWLDSVG